MEPLYDVVSWIMVAFHQAFTSLGMPPAAGATWALSIVGLVVVIRILLIPLFVKQIRAQRAMQLIQPEVKKLQEKYKHDREQMSKELMQLYRDRNTNPFASCLPLLAQAPIFFALFWLLENIGDGERRGVLTDPQVQEAKNARLFDAQLFDTFMNGGPARTVAAVLIVVMTASTFWQQRQLIMKNMPEDALTSSFAKQQKVLMYVFPAMFLVTGIHFPIGVLIYWCTTNLWSLGQQLYVISRMPAPGSPAEKKLLSKRQQQAPDAGKETTGGPRGDKASTTDAGQPAGGDTGSTAQRRQQRKQPKSKRK